MTALIVLASYLTVAMLSARRMYGVLRAKFIDGGKRAWPNLYADPVKEFEQTDRPFVKFLSLFASLAWPLAWPAMVAFPALYRFMDGTTVRSQHELEQEREQMSRRIADLERELGL